MSSAIVTDQSDHRPDPKADFPSNATDAEPLRPQGQRCLHFPGVALLDRATTKLLTRAVSDSAGAFPPSRLAT